MYIAAVQEADGGWQHRPTLNGERIVNRKGLDSFHRTLSLDVNEAASGSVIDRDDGERDRVLLLNKKFGVSSGMGQQKGLYIRGSKPALKLIRDEES